MNEMMKQTLSELEKKRREKEELITQARMLLVELAERICSALDMQMIPIEIQGATSFYYYKGYGFVVYDDNNEIKLENMYVNKNLLETKRFLESIICNGIINHRKQINEIQENFNLTQTKR